MVAGTIKLYTKRSVFNIITSELEREPLSISSLDVILVCVVPVHTQYRYALEILKYPFLNQG